ncbi:MAG: ABC transporter ATP-binding protein [Clostridia bacterium]
MFEANGLNVHYDLIHVIKNISFRVDEGEIVTLIGANGAGKTTTLRTLSGLKKPTSGTITFEGADITSTSPAQRVKIGISQVPEGRRVFVDMSVLENLEMGALLRNDNERIGEDLNTVFAYFPVLKERKRQAAGTLSGGEQQMLAMGRALMSRPRLLLLDEPSMGLSPLLVQEIFNIIKEINQRGTTILLVEQNAGMALKIANRAYVMETGNIVLSGNGNEMISSPEIMKAYLGG